MKSVFAAVALSVATLAVVISSPANATCKYYPCPPKVVKHNGHHNGHAGKFVVGCIMGSALGAIGTAWRVSQAQNRELTQGEAWTALSFCGLGSFLVASQPVAQPRTVAARY
jgi:hypothetical protein